MAGATQFYLPRAGGEALKVKSQLVGKHWLASVLSGLAVARALQLDLQKVVPTVEHVSPFPSRLQPMRLPGGAVVLRDEYNASVPSLVASLEVLREASCEGKRVLAIGVSGFAIWPLPQPTP